MPGHGLNPTLLPVLLLALGCCSAEAQVPGRPPVSAGEGLRTVQGDPAPLQRSHPIASLGSTPLVRIDRGVRVPGDPRRRVGLRLLIPTGRRTEVTAGIAASPHGAAGTIELHLPLF